MVHETFGTIANRSLDIKPIWFLAYLSLSMMFLVELRLGDSGLEDDDTPYGSFGDVVDGTSTSYRSFKTLPFTAHLYFILFSHFRWRLVVACVSQRVSQMWRVLALSDFYQSSLEQKDIYQFLKPIKSSPFVVVPGHGRQHWGRGRQMILFSASGQADSDVD